MKETNVNLVEARKMVQNRSKRQWFVKGYGCGSNPEEEPSQ